MALTPPPAAPQRGDRATFAQRVDAFITWLISFVGEFNAAIASLNAWLAGGAYSIPYTYNWKALVGTPGGGVLAHNDPFYLLSATDYLYLDLNSAAARSVAALINEMDDSTSTIRGKIRIEKQGDPTKWALFDVIGPSVHSANHSALRVSWTAASASPNPFTQGERLILFFQRTGDKGDTGAMPVYPYAEFTEQHASGVSANGGANATGTYDRNLNTTVANGMGAVLSGGSFTLQAGTYDFEAIACAVANSSSHNKVVLQNTTDNTNIAGTGTIMTGSTSNIFSSVGGRFTITAPKTYKLRTWIGAVGTSPGQSLSSGYPEIYAQIKLWKLA